MKTLHTKTYINKTLNIFFHISRRNKNINIKSVHKHDENVQELAGWQQIEAIVGSNWSVPCLVWTH